MMVMGLFLATTSCKKNAYTYPPGIPADNTGVSKIEKNGEFSEVKYNADGSIQTIVRKQADGTVLTNYVFSYENGKLKEINFLARWKYTYTGDLLTQVETYNASGQLRYRYEFAYTNGQLTERTDYLINASTTGSPKFKTLYYYRADGNVSKKEIFEYLNDAWRKAEEVWITGYDQYVNVSDRFESYPYLPAHLFSPNNPLKEIWYDELGQTSQTVDHAYTYDVNGRPKTKTSTYRYPGFPDTGSETRIEY